MKWLLGEISREMMTSYIYNVVQSVNVNATEWARSGNWIGTTEILWGESLYPFPWIVYVALIAIVGTVVCVVEDRMNPQDVPANE